MLLAGGKKPKIHLDATPKKRTILLWRTLENRIITSFYWESRCLRSFTSGFNCVKKRWRALAISAPFFICTDLLEIYFPFFSFLNTTLATKAAFSRFTNKSICMTFLHQRHFFCHCCLCVCACGTLKERESLLSGKKNELQSVWQTLYPEPLHSPGAFSPALKHVAAVRGNTRLAKPPLFRL